MPVPSASAAAQSATCQVAAGVTRVEGLPEASGVTMSRRTPGLLWSHNDSGKPVLFAVDSAGAVKGRVQVAGADVEDWEDIAAAVCPSGPCLYVADIGDNNRIRREITVYRLAEPDVAAGATSPVETFTARYPDGPHDAEALFVGSGGELFLITKDREAALYRWPQPLRAGTIGTLERVRTLSLPLVTGADASPDGRSVAVRTNRELAIYGYGDLLAGRNPMMRVPLTELREPQGEAVTLANDGRVFLMGEGSGRAGTLARLECRLE